jgi:hypothetical protein
MAEGKGFTMEKPTGPKTLTLDRQAAVDDRCDLAKRSFNSARRGKLAYQALVFVLAVVLVVAAIYAVIAFNDEEEARGFLGLVVALGSLATGGFLGLLAKDASKDEADMWARVESSCNGE